MIGTERSRTHPITPVLSAGRSLAWLVPLLLVATPEELDAYRPLVMLVVGGLWLAVSIAWGYLAWSHTDFGIDGAGDLRVDSGVLSRQERRVVLSRLQGVEVATPLLGRVFGMAELRIEVAGGRDSHVSLKYLTQERAQEVRAELLALAAGVGRDAGEAPEVVLVTVPTGDLVLSLLMRSETVLLLAVSIAVVATTVATEELSALGLLLITGGLPLISVFGEFSRFFGFSLAESPDGLRMGGGLVGVTRQTVPPGRVQAVELAEPLLWRRRGWVRVNLNVAGGQQEGEQGRVGQVLLPVAPRAQAVAILSRILPGVDVEGLVFDPAPAAARRRAWLQWRQLGVAVDSGVLATRRGWITRRTALVPHARTQSVTVVQGPWQRRLGLATMQVDTTPGPVAVAALHRGSAQARRMAEEQLARAAQARLGVPERWLSGAAEPPTGREPSSDGRLP